VRGSLAEGSDLGLAITGDAVFRRTQIGLPRRLSRHAGQRGAERYAIAEATDGVLVSVYDAAAFLGVVVRELDLALVEVN
jgi:hypothetical protein